MHATADHIDRAADLDARVAVLVDPKPYLTVDARVFAHDSECARSVDGGGRRCTTSYDVRLEVGPDESRTVQHHLRYRIIAGHFKTFDLVGIDPRGLHTM